MKNIFDIRSILTIVVLAALFSSCVQDAGNDGLPAPVVDEGSLVVVPVTFSMDYQGEEDPYVGGSLATRAASSGIVEDRVLDAWILQFGGLDDDSPLVTRAQYIADVTAVTNISLGSTAKAHRIVAVANTSRMDYPLTMEPGTITFGEFRGIYTKIYGEQEIWYENRIPMSGYQDMTTGISAGSVIQIPMKRNMAKIVLNLDNAADSGIKIDKMQVFNISRYVEPFGGITNRDGGIYPNEDMGAYRYFNSEETSVSIGQGDSGQWVWYVPRNRQGQTNSLSSKEKNYYAPSDATYIKLWGTNMTSGQPVVYTLYPGANMVNDHNIDPGKRYTLNIKFSKMGDPLVDGRVENYELIDLKGEKSSTNSFIINPPAPDFDARRIYRIYPVRAIEYWGRDGYDYTPAYNIGSIAEGYQAEWKLYIAWADIQNLVRRMPANPADMLPNMIYYSVDDNAKGVETYFDIHVPAGVPIGNFGLAMYIDVDDSGDRGTNEPCVWSWHFWVTHYNPDVQVVIPDDQKHFFKVPNGEVHRYDGPNWEEGGMYSNAVIMDRSIGCANEDHMTSYNHNNQTPTNRVGLYYQWGRKDPFSLAGCYGEDGVRGYFQYVAQKVEIAEGIYNPTNRYSGGSFTTQYTLSAPYELWFDPKIMGTVAQLSVETRKSIFDPCPRGWQVPTSLVWKDVDMTDELDNLNDLYPRSGYIHGSSGVVNVGGIYMMTSTRSTDARYFHYFGYKQTTTADYMALVRCVKLNAN